MSKRWYNRLLISYLPIFLVIVFTLSISFFLFISYISQQQAKHANGLFVEQVILKLDKTLEQIDRLIMREVTSNEKLYAFYDEKMDDRFAGIMEPSRKLQELISLAPEIDTIYMYRKDKGLVLSQNTISSLEDYGDRAFITDMLAQGGSTNWLPARSFREFPDDKPKDVITLVRKAPILTGEKGLIVVNVKTQTLTKIIEEMSGNPLNSIRVKDQNGTYFETPKPTELASRIVSEKSFYTGWEYVSIIRDAGFYQLFSWLHIVWIIGTLLLICLGILWIIYVSRTQYKPIEAIMGQIRSLAMQSKQPSSLSGKDEFLFIQTAITRLIEETNEYSAKYKADSVYRRFHLFLDLVQGNAPVRRDEWTQIMNELQLSSDHQALQMAVLEIDKFPEFEVKYGYRDQSLFKFVLKNVTIEISEKYGLSAWPEWVENDRLAVLFLKKEPMQTDVETLCGEMVSWVNENIRFTVTIGIGTIVERLEDVSASFYDAINALKYKSSLGFNRHISYYNVRASSEHQVYDRLHDIRHIIQLFIQGDVKWNEAFGRLMAGLKEDMMPIDDIVVAMNYLNYYLNQSMMELASEYRLQWKQSIYPKLLVIMDECETLEEVKERYTALLTETFEYIGAERERSSAHALMRQVRQFINDKYADPDLSLNYLGDHFKLNIKSLSQMFKEEFGERFVDYLSGLRVRQARTLLEETDLSVQDIATRVGYLHVHTFNRVFKKVMDSTPGDYRKQQTQAPKRA